MNYLNVNDLKLIKLLFENKLIGHDEQFDKMSLEQLFG